jgi:hypothetical protein
MRWKPRCRAWQKRCARRRPRRWRGRRRRPAAPARLAGAGAPHRRPGPDFALRSRRGRAALALELGLARSALANADEAGFRGALARTDEWLRRLYADGSLLREWRARLAKLRKLELHYELPIAGATLKQLQALQHGRRQAS